MLNCTISPVLCSIIRVISKVNEVNSIVRPTHFDGSLLNRKSKSVCICVCARCVYWARSNRKVWIQQQQQKMEEENPYLLSNPVPFHCQPKTLSNSTFNWMTDFVRVSEQALQTNEPFSSVSEEWIRFFMRLLYRHCKSRTKFISIGLYENFLLEAYGSFSWVFSR